LSSPSTYTSTTRPLDALAASIVVVLCLSWGFNQVATKLAIHDIPPVTQAAVRSAVAALLISAWCRLRGIALLKRDGTLWFGIAAGILFAAEFVLIFQGLLYTTASRATLFIYLAPFFVVLRCAHCAACRSF
jgi:drug/metabolite transporter (DMT)-like permease